MGPLVPHIISSDFSLIIAIILGFGFGFALEQAGFGSTRKLVGLFYGYDFTVLKVFFTAGVTAMIGVILLNHLGLLNIDIIYINPTFLYAALLGGAIMGVGFIIGGFCPGTSVCAAATGKMDGMTFIIGALLGIFVFTESYPLISVLDNAANMGNVLMFEMLGMSREVFALITIIIAVSTFYIVQKIEDKVNRRKASITKKSIITYSISGGVAILLVLITLVTPTRSELVHQRIEKMLLEHSVHITNMDGDELADELISQYYKYNLIDVRSKEDFDKFHIPTAINIPLTELSDIKYRAILKQREKTNIFYAENDNDSKRAYLIAEYFGKAENIALTTSAQEFHKNYFDIESLSENASKREKNIYHFRVSAATKLNEIKEALSKMDKPVEKKVTRVQGGCS
ncbi:YeeE/YedE thiosulfate transporter family protein [Carboxylicivirga caseinilyticus]|uniref:YeeE/YedE thiosulfate transporter family protein n=1 Tax=Carboxylicivirga caseinilyticus TaxID=3417572 RepID=UPI003D32F158|nr:YeeE/YedE family protein [Marinilabiliaceae bacterium A049]